MVKTEKNFSKKKTKIILVIVGILALLIFTNPTDENKHLDALYDSLMSYGTLSPEQVLTMVNSFRKVYRVDNYILFSIGSPMYINDPIKTFGILGQTFML